MKITENKIDEIANLAKLEFDDHEKVKIKNDLEKIVDFFDKLSEVDTENVEPLIYMNQTSNNLREDMVKNELSKTEALINAPDKDSDYFKVPKFIKK